MSASRYHFLGKKIRTWDVDQILDKKIVGGKPRYLVKWRRTFSELNTWELRESFSDLSIVENFETELQKTQQSVRHSILTHQLSENPRRSLSAIPGPVEAKNKPTNAEERKRNTNEVEKSHASNATVNKYSQDSKKVEIIKNLMETELQCCICQDVFKNPCITNCEHIFCDKCIDHWKSLNRTCPVCRSVLLRSEKKLVRIDNFITKAVDVLKE